MLYEQAPNVTTSPFILLFSLSHSHSHTRTHTYTHTHAHTDTPFRNISMEFPHFSVSSKLVHAQNYAMNLNNHRPRPISHRFIYHPQSWFHKIKCTHTNFAQHPQYSIRYSIKHYWGLLFLLSFFGCSSPLSPSFSLLFVSPPSLIIFPALPHPHSASDPLTPFEIHHISGYYSMFRHIGVEDSDHRHKKKQTEGIYLLAESAHRQTEASQGTFLPPLTRVQVETFLIQPLWHTHDMLWCSIIVLLKC